MQIRTHYILGSLLLLLAIFAMVWRGWIGEQRSIELTGKAMSEKELSPGDGRLSSPVRQRYEKKGFPVLGWDTALRHAKNRNRLEFEGRLALLDERIGLSDNLKLNLRSHMEGYYAAWEREWTENGRWTWPDHREIAWNSICASSFVSDE